MSSARMLSAARACRSRGMQLFAVFEIQTHPLHSDTRMNAVFNLLDALIFSLALTTLGSADPRTSTFAPGAVPVVPASLIVHQRRIRGHAVVQCDAASATPGAAEPPVRPLGARTVHVIG